MEYDLAERTKIFSKNVIVLLCRLKKDAININVISQLSKSATSIGANYCEANNASSRKDFRNKIYICKKEAQETKYWLEMLAVTNKEEIERLRILWKEAHELTLIFNKIAFSLKIEN